MPVQTAACSKIRRRRRKLEPVEPGLTSLQVNSLAIGVGPGTVYAGTSGAGVFAIQSVQHQVDLPQILR